MFWQWICWIPEPNRRAKPLSAGQNFSSGKFFVAIDREERVFQSGIQIERAPSHPGPDEWPIRIESDWDWQVLMKELRGEKFPRLLRRWLKEGFRIRAGAFSHLVEFDRSSFDIRKCLRQAGASARTSWGGFQLFWPMKEKEVQVMPGPEIVESVAAVFDELTSAMNLCMYSPCLKERPVIQN